MYLSGYFPTSILAASEKFYADMHVCMYLCVDICIFFVYTVCVCAHLPLDFQIPLVLPVTSCTTGFPFHSIHFYALQISVSYANFAIVGNSCRRRCQSVSCQCGCHFVGNYSICSFFKSLKWREQLQAIRLPALCTDANAVIFIASFKFSFCSRFLYFFTCLLFLPHTPSVSQSTS